MDGNYQDFDIQILKLVIKKGISWKQAQISSIKEF